jgi:hypothetical protein
MILEEVMNDERLQFFAEMLSMSVDSSLLVVVHANFFGCFKEEKSNWYTLCFC